MKTGTKTAVAPRELTQRYRHELKYFISFTDHKVLSDILADTLQADPHSNRQNEYWIRSLYFDTPGNNDYYEKMIGVDRRKKVRLRIYHTDQPEVNVEIKYKVNEYILKETALVTREDAAALINGNKEILLNYHNTILNQVYYIMSKDLYRPVVIVDYEREAYISPTQDIRITFDKSIRGSSVDFDLFSKDINMSPVFDEKTMVMEIKYNHFFPDWLRSVLSLSSGERYAISKYCLSRSIY